MIKKHPFLSVIIVLGIFSLKGCSSAETSHSSKIAPKPEVVTMANESLKEAATQYRFMMQDIPDERFPKTFFADSNKFETSNSGWWTSGFYPGTLLYLYEETGDQELWNEAMRIMKHLEKEQYNTTTHDLGFMMYCSFGNAHRIKPNNEFKEILINSAKSLATRYSPTVGAIRSWDFSDPEDFMVIIDNMMNLELLFWATKTTGDSTYYKIAVDHANTTIENHFRPDNSSFHLVTYKTSTGEVKEKKTVQGYADESAWARGQSWGFYGYVVMYRETKDPKYLEQAKKIADFVLTHPNLPKDKIPYWDYNAPNIPEALRDASASAILASGLLELSEYVDDEEKSSYFNAAETIISNLSTEPYKAKEGENGGFILKHSVGHLPQKSEVDVPLTYADYYYVEALKRYKESGD